jgi:hypothetical protein
MQTVLAKGLPASPGAVTGEVTFSPEEAETLAKAGKAVILVRYDLSFWDDLSNGPRGEGGSSGLTYVLDYLCLAEGENNRCASWLLA